VESLRVLESHYKGLLGDFNESYLLHSAGNGKNLPPLYAPTGEEVATQVRQKSMPYRLLARLLKLVRERENPKTGAMEWIVAYKDDGLERRMTLNGDSWKAVFEGAQSQEAQSLIETEVRRKVSGELQHVRDKEQVLDDFNALANEVLAKTDDVDDPDYVQIATLKPQIRELLGLKLSVAAA
jgi:hypothetical protein